MSEVENEIKMLKEKFNGVTRMTMSMKKCSYGKI